MDQGESNFRSPLLPSSVCPGQELSRGVSPSANSRVLRRWLGQLQPNLRADGAPFVRQEESPSPRLEDGQRYTPGFSSSSRVEDNSYRTGGMLFSGGQRVASPLRDIPPLSGFTAPPLAPSSTCYTSAPPVAYTAPPMRSSSSPVPPVTRGSPPQQIALDLPFPQVAAAGNAAAPLNSGERNGNAGTPDESQTTHSHKKEKHLDILQFSAPIYFVEENEGFLQVDVMRLGSMKGKIKAKYKTEDASAKSGERYQAGSGDVTFKDGDHTRSIKIHVIESDSWAATLEFKVHLTDPENCELGQYLHTARVKIIDNDLFPSSKYRHELKTNDKEDIESINGIKLFQEYLKLCWDAEGVARKTTIILICDQMQNVYLFFTLYVNVYLVDVLFSDEKEAAARLIVPSKQYTAYIIGIMYVGPMLLLHFWSIYKVSLDLGGGLREFLQTNLFRKYLNYSEDARLRVPPSQMHVAIVQDTTELAEGYEATLNMIQVVFKLMLLAYFILLENASALGSIIAMPTLMCIFISFRSRVLIEACEHAAEKTEKVIETVHEACDKYRLIADYAQRPQICDHFAEATEVLSEAQIPAETIRTHNDFFPRWLGCTFIGCYIAFGSNHVFTGLVTAGTFLATVRVFGELAEQFSEGYEELMKVSGAIGPLRKLTLLFNLPTDVLLWKAVNRKRREFTKMARLEVMGLETSDDYPFKSDLIKIKLTGVSFAYSSKQPLLSNINVSVNQGKLVALVGKHGVGKSTFLRLIGHNLFPVEGMVFVPTHLRILHVTQELSIMHLKAWKNLTFGRPNADPKRVREMLTRLNMHKTLAFVNEELEHMHAKHGHAEHGHSAAPASPGKTAVEAEAKGSARSGGGSTSRSSAGDGDEEGEGDNESMMSSANGSTNGNEKAKTSEDSDSDDEEEGENRAEWQDTLAYAEKAKIHLARALIMNPEVLVLQRPLIHYDDDQSILIMDVIEEYIHNRGYCLPKESAHRRRPRTCFFTPSTRTQAARADIIWRIEVGSDGSSKCTEIGHEQLDSADLGK